LTYNDVATVLSAALVSIDETEGWYVTRTDAEEARVSFTTNPVNKIVTTGGAAMPPLPVAELERKAAKDDKGRLDRGNKILLTEKAGPLSAVEPLAISDGV
jgi:hypothetical protein